MPPPADPNQPKYRSVQAEGLGQTLGPAVKAGYFAKDFSMHVLHKPGMAARLVICMIGQLVQSCKGARESIGCDQGKHFHQLLFSSGEIWDLTHMHKPHSSIYHHASIASGDTLQLHVRWVCKLAHVLGSVNGAGGSFSLYPLSCMQPRTASVVQHCLKVAAVMTHSCYGCTPPALGEVAGKAVNPPGCSTVQKSCACKLFS